MQRLGEKTILLSGLVLAAGIITIATGGGLVTWTVAKALYGAGVLLFIFNL